MATCIRHYSRTGNILCRGRAPGKRHFLPAALLALAAQSVPASLTAQQADSIVRLTPVPVSATRSGIRTELELPLSVTRIRLDSARPGLRRNDVSGILFGIPGIQVQERASPAQDARLSIRGFGSRSAFGVRGVRVLRDGIPLSLPDGQTPIDLLDMETIGSVDVIRGTSAALFGNAAGGVVDFHSRAIPDGVTMRFRGWNDKGLSRLNATVATGGTGDTGLLQRPGVMASFTRSVGDGWREWSRQEISSAFVRTSSVVKGYAVGIQGSYYDNGYAENTGALTAAELMRDPTLPDSLNMAKESSKTVSHSILALTVSREGEGRDFNATLFTSARDLENPLPFSVVDVGRRSSGLSMRVGERWLLPSGTVAFRTTAGIDAQWQRDDRSNRENCAGVSSATALCPVAGSLAGALRLSQLEEIRGTGVYARGEVELPQNVFVSGAVRYDRVHFSVSDNFVTAQNGDDSGERSMSATTPMLGVVWRLRPLISLYSNWSVAFETPAMTELTNKQDGSAGLNDVIQPQLTRTVEVGARGWFGGNWHLDASLYTAAVTDELISFDVPGAVGRRAFRNAGRTSRRGLDASLLRSSQWLDAGAAYTWSHFRFVDYVFNGVSYAGKNIPGVPDHQLQMYLTPRAGKAFATIEARVSSEVAADDAGSVWGAGYAAWNSRAGYTLSAARAGELQITGGVDNLFDRRYASSIVTNATRGRYYEPGVVRTFWVGVELNTAWKR